MGATAIALASGAAADARTLMAEGIWFPCLLDPDKQVYRALGIGRITLGWLDAVGWWRYLRAFLRGARQGRLHDPPSGAGRGDPRRRRRRPLGVAGADARGLPAARGGARAVAVTPRARMIGVGLIPIERVGTPLTCTERLIYKPGVHAP